MTEDKQTIQKFMLLFNIIPAEISLYNGYVFFPDILCLVLFVQLSPVRKLAHHHVH